MFSCTYIQIPSIYTIVSYTTIAIKSWNVSAEDAKAKVDEPWTTTLAWDLNTPLAQSFVLSLQFRVMCPFFLQ